MIKESCVETVEQAISAAFLGADQLELCANLDEDGLTPSENCIVHVLSEVSIPIKVMIRSRSGDFYYTQEEIFGMVKEVINLKRYRIDGFVFGALRHGDDGSLSLDINAIRAICKAAFPYPVTIHKAIDLCTDILEEIPKLKYIDNVKFVLSSGGHQTAEQGKKMLVSMQKTATPEISIIAAGKITYDNLATLHSELGLCYYHGRKIVDIQSKIV